MEGDKLLKGERNRKAVYYWFPIGKDGTTIDLSRAKKGKRCERYMHPRFFEILRRGNNLVSLNATEFDIKAGDPEETKGTTGERKPEETPEAGKKRKPLLRLPVWGLPPRWH
jgi:hypothetical protein